LKNKFLLSGLAFILVASLVGTALITSSCSNTKTGATTTNVTVTTSAVTTTAANTPQYGGTLTVLNQYYTQDPAGFDPQLNQRPWTGSIWDNPFVDWLAVGDIEKYGPRGNDAYAFQIDQNVPEQYLTGQVLTGWTVNTTSNPMTITFNVRHGIMWSGNPLDNMAPRELTAADVAYTFNRGFAAPTVSGVYSWVSSVTATDNYTVVLDITTFNAIWQFYLMDGYFPGNPICPEWGNTTASGGSEAWQNTVSDGPFTITNFVSGTGATYTRNPNYWGTTTINGKQYKMPFIDTLVYPEIPDETTAIAALRTGKIDWDYSVPTTYESSLNSTGITHVSWTTGSVDSFTLNRATNKYLENKTVRQALTEATDFTTIGNLTYPGGKVFDWPIMQGDIAYVPLNQMPTNIQNMWTYNPTQAQQMLSSAGYPNGFSLTINIDSTQATQQDVAQLLVNQWAKVGIKASINAVDPTVLENAGDALNYDVMYFHMGPSNFINESNRVLSTAIGSTYVNDKIFDTMWWTMDRDADPSQRVVDEKALAVAMLDDAGWLPMADQAADNYFWPWMKNYYQEIETGYEDKMPMISRIWIDQSTKTSMGD